jgi:hypothetical protein
MMPIGAISAAAVAMVVAAATYNAQVSDQVCARMCARVCRVVVGQESRCDADGCIVYTQAAPMRPQRCAGGVAWVVWVWRLHAQMLLKEACILATNVTTVRVQSELLCMSRGVGVPLCSLIVA